MGSRMNFIFIWCLLALFYGSNGCTMEGVTTWQVPIVVRIEDYFDGIVLQRDISNIGGFTQTSSNDLNGGPYIVAAIEDSTFVLRTNDAYRLFEEQETADLITLTYAFTCTNGQTPSSPLTFRIEINDNNNNAPLFKTPDTAASETTTYDFTIATPVPPGFLITNCVSDIIVRDIDLTTYRIDFTIEDNPYIGIEYDEAASTDAKEFKAVLRSTTFIRSIPEPITLTISATDVDQTGDPPITRSTTVTIHGDSDFEMPLEPIFSQAFYLASYTESDQVTATQPITLEQGYDELVQFSLEGDYAADHFGFSVGDNLVTLTVTNPLPTSALQEGQILLIVRAAREYTSGASATVIVQLPEAEHLEFEQPHYEGVIVDNVLQLTQLVLSQGYQGSDINVTVEDYSSFFAASVVGNTITLSMTPLDESIIQDNNFINLRITASTDYSSATTIVTLEIVKEDVTTPVFERTLYTGTYDSVAGLTLDPILLVQGYDDTVNISVSGEYESYFELTRDGFSSTLQLAGDGLPSHILSQSHLHLSIEAVKPRTVGASAVVAITLPGAREMQFEAQAYKGSVQDNILTLDTIILSVGYDEDVTFSLSGDYSTLFEPWRERNQVTINMPAQLPQEVISENNYLVLTLTAVGVNALSATTAVAIEIIKDDATTPVFSQHIYEGTYLGSLGIDLENINLVQGYDSDVTFRIQGDNSEYFSFTQNNNSVTLAVQSSIPEEVIFNEKVFVFNIFADKPLTVGANAAIVIKFSEDQVESTVMQFAKNTYVGTLEDNELSLEDIVLETGFAVGTEFYLSGEYAESFTHTVTNNSVTILMTSGLPAEVLQNNKFILLELEARRDRAVSVVTGIIVDIIVDEIVMPVFSQAYYSGEYTEENSLQFQETITLIQGYDTTVTFGLEGDNSEYFSLTQNNNSVTLAVQSSIPEEVMFNEKVFVFNIFADKPLTVAANAAIVIKFSEDHVESTVMQFAKNTYVGTLEDNELSLEDIVLETGFAIGTEFYLSGEYAESFTHTVTNNSVTILMTSGLPAEVLENNKFIVLELEARRDRAVSVVTGIIVDIIVDEIVMPVFSQAYYSGEYTEENSLQFQETITLIQGYDTTVTFGLEGESAAWFSVVQAENSVTVVSASPVPQDVLDSNHHLLFTLVAYKPNSTNGHAAISIDLPTDVLQQEVLRFAQSSYEGQLDGGQLQVPTITLSNEITDNVIISLSGVYATYFTATRTLNTVQIELQNELPTEVLSNNEFIVIDIIASKTDAISGYTCLILSIVKEPIIVTPVFEQPYYTGELTEQGELLFDHTIRLIQGFDESVSFALSGDESERFNLTQSGQNSLSISISQGGIDGIENISHFVFSVVASKAGSVSGHAAIVIHNTDSSTASTITFSQNYYKGSIEENVLTMESISIVEGYSADVQLTLSGDYAEYFQLVGEDGLYTLQLVSNISNEIVEAQTMLVYTLEANGDNAWTHATVIIELIKENSDETEELAFEEAYYVGSYSATTGIMDAIQLRVATGYDDATVFTLQGGNSAWFNVQNLESLVTISLAAPLPAELFIDNQPVILTLNAINSAGSTAVATIVVSLEGDLSELTVLGFERNSYLGTIENNVSTLQPITLTQGFSAEVYFTIQGDQSNYFVINQQENIVNVELQSAIPDTELPANSIIVLELQATAVEAVSATTTIVFEVVAAQELSFNAAYYVGQYSETEGLTFGQTITLDAGYDQNVDFNLDGEHSQWFTLQVQENAATVINIHPIPSEILTDNHQLIFIVTAQKSRSNIATATIVISLLEESTNVSILAFESTSYLGSIENDALNIEPIVLNEGYTDAVTFTLSGDLASYFNIQHQGSTVNVELQNTIPEQTLPANGLVFLELHASAPQALTATATLVIEVKRVTVLDELAFSNTYYIGMYSETDGLTFNSVISLDVGYDQNVQFTLDGDHSQWFDLEVQGNAVTLIISGTIPPAILVNNHQLVFTIAAQKLNNSNATATIVISLVDDYTDALVLGFERANYVGSIENNVLTLESIVLNEGFSEAVTFTLAGDLAPYFNIQQDGSAVNIVLQSEISEQTLPINGFVILELHASAPQAISATTTVVIKVQLSTDNEELVFSAAYYIGEYSETSGLAFDSIISLDIGYDQNVQFTLDGDHAQWFALEVQGNAVTLIISGAIPPAILANNHQLVFTIAAQKLNSSNATATIVISLVDDYTDAIVLGFERANYVGSIENNVLTLESIVLNEGFSEAVTFTLAGDLASYFNIQQDGSAVNIVLQSEISEQTLPTNGFVILELHASAPQAISATTTVVIKVQASTDNEELAFSAAYYIGEYSETSGLSFDSIISLDIGYDENVQFALEGEHSQWFALEVQGNAVTLTISSTIPAAILVNNHQLVFSVTAQKTSSNNATATIVVSLVDDYTEATILGFERASYLGSIENDTLSLEPIILNEGYTDAVTFTLSGDLASYFILEQQGSTVNVVLQSTIPEQILSASRIVMLELRASAQSAISATATIVIERHSTIINVEELVFSATYYIGQYSEIEGLEFDSIISLESGYDQNVQFSLEGDHSQWFTLDIQGNAITLYTSTAIPPAVLVNNHQLVFSITAQHPSRNTAITTVVISLIDDYTDATILGFERASYLGTIENNALSLDPIVLTEGYIDTVIFTLSGDLASHFSIEQQGSTVNIIMQSVIPDQTLPTNGIVLIELRASSLQAIPATATIVFEVLQQTVAEELVFSAAHYIGEFSEASGLTFDVIISLEVGFDENVQFTLEGENAQWFALQVQGNSVTLTMAGTIPPAVLANNHQLVFSIRAQKPNSNMATSTVVISLIDDYSDAAILGFEQASYLGSIENDALTIEPIVLNEGYTDAVTFTLSGDLVSYFILHQQAAVVTIELQGAIPDQALPTNGIILLDLRASAMQAVPATTVIVIDAQRTASVEELEFSAAYYIGEYSEASGLAFDSVISLVAGHDQDVLFSLDGDHAQWFGLAVDENSITVFVVEPIPTSILTDLRKIILTMRATRGDAAASAIIIISVIEDSGTVINEAFDKVLYQGTININVVQHEPITITGHAAGINVEILGVYRELFSATVSGDTVVVGAAGTLTLPESVTHVALELRAGDASAVIIFDVTQSETPELPTVAFASASYVLRADMAQTGLLGQVQASASNGETISYSLAINDAHLRERISINSVGEIHLSASANTGVYSFDAIATSVITQVQATAAVQLTIEAAAICGDDHALPPLIILDRDEEEPHANLVVLDSVAEAGCQFSLTNRWPLDQDWLYVDDTGLHANRIDREDPRIAFMALSQVQVELVLECPNDTQSRVKRSTVNPRLDWLGPYEYGNNKWILTDTILYNSRRSFVNLIVNDINDNYPIFVVNENGPIVCGYPIPELEDIVLPRALAELKATDADVGENAALSFWSSSDVLAVASSTGFVHVRDGASLSHDQTLTVSVTDLNGREGGLTASIQLLVKLLDTSHIAVVTVRNAFLDQEETILGNLSSAVGYEVKVLSSAVISDDPADYTNARRKRQVTTDGASLQLYVYGVIDREPVAVDQLTIDITENVSGVDVTSTVSLEDYLEGREIYHTGRDTGLLVATIVLSILLFILMLLIALWFFLRWRKARNYEQFSDANSLASRNEPIESPAKVDSLRKPRLNIDELKRSERRLQEMLDAPIDGVGPKAQTSKAEPEQSIDTLINVSPIRPTDVALPIVIQSIDKLKDDVNLEEEDEFGERKNKSRRKSVVTFNENVEKIIHVEDIPDDNSSDVEIFKL